MHQANMKQEDAFLRKIKEETALMHTMLEQNPLSVKLMDPGVDVTHYAIYLSAMREVIAYTEADIFHFVEHIVRDVQERRKLSEIEKDLADLRRCTFVPVFEKFGLPTGSISEPFALGVMYVVEGSTLGGRMIVRHLLQRPAVAYANAFRFFNGYGEQTGMRWKDFLAVFSAYGASTPNSDEIINGAKQAFQAIHNHFATVPVHAQ